jgi:predicted kinase
VVMVGPSGVGKSAVAEAIAPFLGAEVIRSDVVRKRLAGLDPTARPSPESLAALYSDTLSFRTYMEMARGAERALRKGRPVVLDATYLRRGSRDGPALLARKLGCPYAYLAVDCESDEVRARIERRTLEGGDPSDATWEVHRKQVATIEPFDEVEVPRAALWDGCAEPVEALAPIVETLAR